ncbi:heme/hemin ABC transporter substrate-binding protein [Mucilaginibacter aquaedulcis]|uniref:heme/hemin ABC transporter substrate-binding protein n=1 Tax=Mucilaginibacter aquaedulcis TaxID=1187081 RepID=UPI0025B3DF72|nr:ABC transporter substrate-binding protein [Mucilaginibacter aquaedulcis]MDN3547786.1 ABC transporter substrate-binding protein [Mucilaginibacter aquaedulcis]
MKKIILAIILSVFLVNARAGEQLAANQKIVSLNGTVSEILVGLGFENNIIGTDVTSNYPESLKSKPKIGHYRNISAEGIIALQPDVVTGLSTEIKPELAAQLKSAGIKLVMFTQDFSPDGTRKLIKDMATAFGGQQQANVLIKKLDTDLATAGKLNKTSARPKVLFIYARGAGTMMVSGDNTPLNKIIQLAGGQNAVTGFNDYKPLTSEALVAANPDAILLFSSGMESLGGAAGLLNVQGISQTNAGKNKKFITMEGELLTGFGPRLGQAIAELSQKLK